MKIFPKIEKEEVLTKYASLRTDYIDADRLYLRHETVVILKTNLNL
jgi:hypothetical protein